MDLNLLRTDVGTVIISSAMFDDLVGWILFSMVLGMLHPPAGGSLLDGVKHTVVLVVLFVGLTLTLGRWLFDKILPFLQAHTTWPGGVLGFIFTLTLAGAAFTEYAGIHAVFGAFVIGIAIGESGHLRKRTSEHIHQIVTNVFAPFFFASIGLRTDFVSKFDWHLTATVVGVACVGKLLGAGWGARLGGMDRTSSLVVGTGDERARSDGNHSRNSGAASGIDPRIDVCRACSYGAPHVTPLGTGDSLPGPSASIADLEGYRHSQAVLAEPEGDHAAGSIA